MDNNNSATHIHILGICGTFMGGLALIARQLGYRVTGSDQNVYPPMSTMLEKTGIEIIQGFDIEQLNPRPQMVIIGNAMSRGNPCVEYILNEQIPYTSGPQWLHDNLLSKKRVLAVSGTHGKTTTSSMLTWILEKSGLNPSFLIGGVTGNFKISARLTDSDYFVIEADEYDTAFFDKRSKFLHYSPYRLIINNLGFDHADIFDDLKAIQRQFHHLIRTIPSQGCIFSHQKDISVEETLAMGCWSEQQKVGDNSQWNAHSLNQDCSSFQILNNQQVVAEVHWNIFGEHNMFNALMALAVAQSIGIDIQTAASSLSSFINTSRRLEIKGSKNGVTVYDDFAHHPQEISATIDALRSNIKHDRLIAVLEPRSNTMKMGKHKSELAESLKEADLVFILQPDNIPWSVSEIAEQLAGKAYYTSDLDELITQIASQAKGSDKILIMSNGSFGGIHQKLLDQL